jgi:hypothetical protein
MPLRRWTSEEEDRLLEFRARGLTWLRVARSLGRSEASVVCHYLTKLKNRKIVAQPVSGSRTVTCCRVGRISPSPKTHD